MNKRLTRIASISSISFIAAAMFSVSAASSTTPSEAPEPVKGPVTEEAVELAVLSDYPDVQTKKAKSAPMPREYRAAVSKDAKDLKGYEKSLYRGKFYYKDQESFRKCVMDRESNFRYKAANSRSSARGAYQFLDNHWRDGLVHMMIKESKKKDHGLEKRLKRLFDKPIHRWNRYYQDRAFFTALNYNGKWSGKKHWNATVPGTGC